MLLAISAAESVLKLPLELDLDLELAIFLCCPLSTPRYLVVGSTLTPHFYTLHATLEDLRKESTISIGLSGSDIHLSRWLFISLHQDTSLTFTINIYNSHFILPITLSSITPLTFLFLPLTCKLPFYHPPASLYVQTRTFPHSHELERENQPRIWRQICHICFSLSRIAGFCAISWLLVDLP